MPGIGRGARALPALLLGVLLGGCLRTSPAPTFLSFHRSVPGVPVAARIGDGGVRVLLRNGMLLQVSPDTLQPLDTLPSPVLRAAFYQDTLYGITERGNRRMLWRWTPRGREILYRPPDSLGPALEDLQPLPGGVLVQMLGRLVLQDQGRWRTLPFTVDHFRLFPGNPWVLWGYRAGVVWQSRSSDRGRHWTPPDTVVQGIAFFAFHEGLRTHLLGAFEPQPGALPVGLLALAPNDSLRLVLEPGQGYPLRFLGWHRKGLYGLATSLWSEEGVPRTLRIRWYRFHPTFKILQDTVLSSATVPLDSRWRQDTLWLLSADTSGVALRAFPAPRKGF